MKAIISVRLSIVFLIFTSVFVGACSKMDDTYKNFLEGGEIRYSKKPDTIGVYPGHNRAEVWFAVSAPDVSKGKIYWNDRLDSLEIPIVRTGKTDTISTIIDNLAEGSHIFEFVTYDFLGNPSLPIDTTGYVYGDVYISSLNPRIVEKASLINNNVNILWSGETNANAIGSELQYTSQDGEVHIVNVKVDDVEMNINPRPMTGSIKYRGMFLPHPLAIDTFHTDYVILKPDAVYEGFPETFEDLQYKKSAYPAATVEIGSGVWLLDNFLIGQSVNDKKHGDRSIRSHRETSIMEMKHDLPDGAAKISFYHGICSSDEPSTFKVQASRDGGDSWEDISEVYTNDSILAFKEINVNWNGPIRFRFYKFSSEEDSNSIGRMNIDDIDIYPNL